MRISLFLAATLVATSAVHAAAEADLLVAYDQSYVTTNGSDANTRVIIANAVAGSNAIQDRCGTGARVRVVGYYQGAQANYQATSNGGFVGWLNSYDSRLSDVVDAGNARGADLVTFICDSTDDGAAAVASQPGRYSSFDSSAFWSTVVAHELAGHNYGCDHRGGKDNPKTVMLHNYCGGGAQPYYSNPNIWLNGVNLRGIGSCLGDATDSGDNSYLISTTAQSVADRYARIVTAPSLANVVRHWSFNQTAGTAIAGTTVTDSVSGTAVATVRGTGATFTGNGLKIPGGASGSGAAYLQLPAGILSSLTNATLEIWATPLSVQNWGRVMDFNNGSANYLTLSSSNATDLNVQRFESKLAGVTVSRDSGIATVAGLQNHYTITYASNGSGGGRWTWYRNGDAVAYLDVAYPLSSLPDVNNWLGRSAYTADGFANCEYAEVRVSSIAMSRDQVLANYRLGPNWQGSNVTLTADDAVGSASFNAAGLWSDGLAPSSTKSYETYGFRLRTPADRTSRTFAGQSLKVTGGGIVYKGTSSSTTTFGNLTLAGDSELLQAGSGTWTLAGNLAVEADQAMVRGANGPITLSANLSGKGSLLYATNTIRLTGSNASFTGKTIIGDGRSTGLTIDSEDRLGTNPTAFTADQLTLNRGTLYTTTTMAIDDANRGIRIGVSAGIFNVAPSTTLTVAVPLSCVASGSTLQTATLVSNPISGMLIKENTGTLVLTHPNNSHNGEIFINGGGLTISGAGRLNNGTHVMPITDSGILTFDSTAAQTISGVISGAGSLVKSSTGMLTVTGANTLTGSVTINGGTLYANLATAANNLVFSYVSGITVNSGGTLRSARNSLFGSDGTQEKPITINAGGTLTATGGLTTDVGLGLVTLNGGTMSTLTTFATDYGSFRFDDATDKLLVTDNSSVSATNVKFGNAAAAIEVASGKTLAFTGTITNATTGGISYLRKAGAGTLTLSGTNTYTGSSAIDAGTVKVNGSLATGSAVTVASGAIISGTGTISGPVTFTDGAVHAPGDATGTQTIGGALSYAGTAHLRSTLLSQATTTGAASRIAAGNVTVGSGATIDFTLNATGSTVDFTDAFWKQSRTWNLLTCTSKTGDFTLGAVSTDATGHSLSSYGTLSLQQSNTSVNLVYTPYTPTELWKQAKFGADWNNPAISGDEMDPDHDGLSNLLEYALGSDPAQPSITIVPQVTTITGKLKITFTRNTAATDVTISVMAADDLASSWTEIARSVNGSAFSLVAAGASVDESGTGDLSTVQATDIYLISDPSHPKRFMRVEVKR